jgi:hypothetical protein
VLRNLGMSERIASESLGPVLAREHAAWLEEVRAALGPAQGSSASPWARWNAIRYLEQTFPERLTRERRLVQAVSRQLSATDQEQLWALGELLDALHAYLPHLVGLCHRAGEFAEVTTRILTALGRWCRAVERALGPLPVSVVPTGLREPFGLAPDEPAAVAS